MEHPQPSIYVGLKILEMIDLTPRLKLQLVYQRTFLAPSLAGRQALPDLDRTDLA